MFANQEWHAFHAKDSWGLDVNTMKIQTCINDKLGRKQNVHVPDSSGQRR